MSQLFLLLDHGHLHALTTALPAGPPGTQVLLRDGSLLHGLVLQGLQQHPHAAVVLVEACWRHGARLGQLGRLVDGVELHPQEARVDLAVDLDAVAAEGDVGPVEPAIEQLQSFCREGHGRHHHLLTREAAGALDATPPVSLELDGRHVGGRLVLLLGLHLDRHARMPSGCRLCVEVLWKWGALRPLLTQLIALRLGLQIHHLFGESVGRPLRHLQPAVAHLTQRILAAGLIAEVECDDDVR
mmetsp:Transcript_32641/g.80808  ORF Transcript_32641/g.80808 Transcript_32641/m.80808 type:complete len:242 (-) Transcript_32641:537-1262(-)